MRSAILVRKRKAAGTLYSNPGGQGNRTGSITVSSNMSLVGTLSGVVDGSTGNAVYESSDGLSTVGSYYRFDFGTARVVDEVTVHTQSGVTRGSWKWQGSNNASSWTDIGTSAEWSSAASQVWALGNTTAYRYYQIIGVSGTNRWYYTNEFNFKIGP